MSCLGLQSQQFPDEYHTSLFQVILPNSLYLKDLFKKIISNDYIGDSFATAASYQYGPILSMITAEILPKKIDIQIGQEISSNHKKS